MDSPIDSRNKQFPRTAHVVVALIVSFALWGVMVFWTLAYLRRTAGGLEPFDLRPFGYTPEEARKLLYALSSVGRKYYADVQLQLDTAFPAALRPGQNLIQRLRRQAALIDTHLVEIRQAVKNQGGVE